MNTAKKSVITDEEITQVLSLREMRKVLNKKLDNIEANLKKSESELIELLECGCDVDCSFNISINESSKTYPKYKQEIEKRLGNGVTTGKIHTSRNLSAKTLYDYAQSAQKYTKRWWRKPAADISIADVKQLLYDILHEFNRSQSIQRKVKCVINSVFEWGIVTGKIKGVVHSPALNVKLVGRKVEKQPEILTQKQISQFLYLAKRYDHAWFPVWFFAVHSGGRSGELYALEWSDIDFDGRRIFFNKSFDKRTNSIGPTKGGYWREVPINNELLSFLRKQKIQLANSKYVLPRLTDWDRSAQAKVLRTFLTQIGLPSIKFHTLRACFATHLLRNGVAVVTVMKIGGWKDMDTMQRYVRLAGIEVQGATDILSFLSPDEMMGKITELYR